MHSAGPLSFIIHGRVTEEQASPVAGNGHAPRSKVQRSRFNVDETAFSLNFEHGTLNFRIRALRGLLLGPRIVLATPVPVRQEPAMMAMVRLLFA
jgi:hypothetical protein